MKTTGKPVVFYVKKVIIKNQEGAKIYVAKDRIRRITESMEEPKESPEDVKRWARRHDLYFTRELEPKSVLQLDDDIAEAIRKMEEMEDKNCPP